MRQPKISQDTIPSWEVSPPPRAVASLLRLGGLKPGLGEVISPCRAFFVRGFSQRFQGWQTRHFPSVPWEKRLNITLFAQVSPGRHFPSKNWCDKQVPILFPYNIHVQSSTSYGSVRMVRILGPNCIQSQIHWIAVWILVHSILLWSATQPIFFRTD